MDNIFMFISGFSGTGKSHLIRECIELFPEYSFQDFDDFFFTSNGDWIVEPPPKGKEYIQNKLEKFIADQDKPIVLAGVNMLNNNLHAQCNVVLTTPFWQVVRQLWRRAKNKEFNESRWRAPIGGLHSIRMRHTLIRRGFIPLSQNQIISMLYACKP